MFYVVWLLLWHSVRLAEIQHVCGYTSKGIACDPINCLRWNTVLYMVGYPPPVITRSIWSFFWVSLVVVCRRSAKFRLASTETRLTARQPFSYHALMAVDDSDHWDPSIGCGLRSLVIISRLFLPSFIRSFGLCFNYLIFLFLLKPLFDFRLKLCFNKSLV